MAISKESMDRLAKFSKQFEAEMSRVASGKRPCECGECKAKAVVVLQLAEQIRTTIVEPLQDETTFCELQKTPVYSAIFSDFVGRYLSEPFWSTVMNKKSEPRRDLTPDQALHAYAEILMLSAYHRTSAERFEDVAAMFRGLIR